MTGQDRTQTQKQTSRPELRAGVKRKARVVMYDVMPVINQDYFIIINLEPKTKKKQKKTQATSLEVRVVVETLFLVLD